MLHKFLSTKILLAALAVMLIASALTYAAPFAAAASPDLAPDAPAWSTAGNALAAGNFLGSTNNFPLIFKANNVERMRILTSGWVGMGVANPGVQLHVKSANARERLQSTSTNVWTSLEFQTDARQYDLGVGGSAVSNDVKNKFYLHDVTANTTRMVITPQGNVGINLTSPTHTLEVAGDLMVKLPNGLYTLHANTDRTVSVGALASSTTHHLCYFGYYTLSTCSSAAEYVPSIDAGKGYPETADLVSMAPDVVNPYGDKHGPFTVQKATTACDSNLLGYIVKPESGADGVYLNDHYLPLAIYGYFPAKVTVENGVIHRGDPITSSSKPGYGMKATDACKIVGYALEDAAADGTIQVFASYGENTAPVVASLKRENDTLKQELNAIQMRLLALETNAPATHSTAFAAK